MPLIVRRFVPLTAVAVLALLGVPAATAQSDHPPHTIPGSQIRVLPPNEAGRHYQLHVGLPASYGKEPSRRYPVVYVTDGYWDFAKLTTIHGSLVYDRAFAKSGRALKVRLHVSGGGNESPAFLGGILRFNQRIASRKHEGLAYEFGPPGAGGRGQRRRPPVGGRLLVRRTPRGPSLLWMRWEGSALVPYSPPASGKSRMLPLGRGRAAWRREPSERTDAWPTSTRRLQGTFATSAAAAYR